MKKSTDLRHQEPAPDTMTPEQPPRWKTWLEYSLVFVVFYIINAWVQYSTPFFADTNDSFYHARMGEMIIDGILQKFPWLYFTSLHENFVDHHLLFHVMMWPFIQLGNLVHSLGWSASEGNIWGPKFMITLSITSLFVMAYHMFRKERLRFAWIWLLFLLCVPYDFFFRMHMIRVQSVSLLVMLLGLAAMWKRNYILLGVLSFAYIWLYGGGFFLPIFALIYVTVRAIQEKELDLQPIWWCFGGAILGLVLNFYFPKNIQFLYSQIFETGLGYQINVGGEWRPYDTWYIFQMGVVVFALQFATISWSLIKGLKQNARSITLLIISFFFLVLMWKSKRFVEYWPFFAVLSSAYMLKDYVQTMYINRIRVFNVFVVLACAYLILNIYTQKLSVPSLTWLINGIPKPLLGVVIGMLVIIAVVSSLYSYMTLSQQKPPIRKVVYEVLVGLLLVILPVYALGGMDAVRRDIAPQTAYINDAQDVMKCILDNGAQKGDIVFTDDWDVFPMFFFFNNTTNYIVGLDPVFMDSWNHALYEEFAGITIGRDNVDLYKKITGDFKATFVVADSEHMSLRTNVEESKGFTKICTNNNFAGYKKIAQ